MPLKWLSCKLNLGADFLLNFVLCVSNLIPENNWAGFRVAEGPTHGMRVSESNVWMKSSGLRNQPKLWRCPWQAGLSQADRVGGGGWSGCKPSLIISDDYFLSLSSRGGTAEQMWADRCGDEQASRLASGGVGVRPHLRPGFHIC